VPSQALVGASQLLGASPHVSATTAPFDHPLYPEQQPPTMPQDMPPTGGYGPVQYKRNLPVRGFRPAVYLVGTGLLMTYGFWRVGQGIQEHKYVSPMEGRRRRPGWV
jgi:hypothetical protein